MVNAPEDHAVSAAMKEKTSAERHFDWDSRSFVYNR